MQCLEFHLNNFKDDFVNISIFFFTPDFQILSKPYVNGNMIYSDDALTLMTGFVVHGHIFC